MSIFWEMCFWKIAISQIFLWSYAVLEVWMPFKTHHMTHCFIAINTLIDLITVVSLSILLNLIQILILRVFSYLQSVLNLKLSLLVTNVCRMMSLGKTLLSSDVYYKLIPWLNCFNKLICNKYKYINVRNINNKTQ